MFTRSCLNTVNGTRKGGALAQRSKALLLTASWSRTIPANTVKPEIGALAFWGKPTAAPAHDDLISCTLSRDDITDRARMGQSGIGLVTESQQVGQNRPFTIQVIMFTFRLLVP
jgi:hypothetical protein